MTPKINALLDQIKSGKMENDKARVLDFIQKNPHATIQDIEINLNLYHETASARVSDLQDLGVVEVSKTERYSHLIYQDNPKKQKVNAFLRKKEKFDRWKKRAKKFEGLLTDNQMDFIQFLNPDIKK